MCTSINSGFIQLSPLPVIHICRFDLNHLTFTFCLAQINVSEKEQQPKHNVGIRGFSLSSRKSHSSLRIKAETVARFGKRHIV